MFGSKFFATAFKASKKMEIYTRAWKGSDLVGGVDPDGPSLFMKLAGTSLAAGSIAFAGYMVGARNADGGLSKPTPGTLVTWHEGTGVLGPFDPMPTGSTSDQLPPQPTTTEIGGVPYVVRNATPASATVEGPQGFVADVKPGSVLPHAGRVLSIEKRGSGWVVVTTLRTIQ